MAIVIAIVVVLLVVVEALCYFHSFLMWSILNARLALLFSYPFAVRNREREHQSGFDSKQGFVNNTDEVCTTKP